MGDFKAIQLRLAMAGHIQSALPARTSNFDKMTSVSTLDRMVRLVAALYVWALALASTQANAQAGATPPLPPHTARYITCTALTFRVIWGVKSHAACSPTIKLIPCDWPIGL